MTTTKKLTEALSTMNDLPDLFAADSPTLQGFTKRTAREIRAVGGTSAGTTLEMIGYMRELEKDAARYRWLRDVALMGAANVNLGDDVEGQPYVEFVPRVRIPEPKDLLYEDGEWTCADIDTSIDRAIAKGRRA